MSDARCKTCRWWQPGAVEDRGVERDAARLVVNELLQDRDYWEASDAERADAFAQADERVRRCASPKLDFYVIPARDGAAVFDGSEYKGELATGPEFGCVNHEPAP